MAMGCSPINVKTEQNKKDKDIFGSKASNTAEKALCRVLAHEAYWRPCWEEEYVTANKS